jgi:phage-related protein
MKTFFMDEYVTKHSLNPKKFKNLLTKQPELKVDRRNQITRNSDEVMHCPPSKSRKFMKILYATRRDGTQPARRGWEALNPKAKAYFTRLFTRICEHGKIEDGSKFKRLQGEIWEFKANAHKKRLTCFMHGKTIYLLHVFKKKEDKTRPQEIELANDIRREQLARLLAKSHYRHYRRYNRNPFRPFTRNPYRATFRGGLRRRFYRNPYFF